MTAGGPPPPRTPTSRQHMARSQPLCATHISANLRARGGGAVGQGAPEMSGGRGTDFFFFNKMVFVGTSHERGRPAGGWGPGRAGKPVGGGQGRGSPLPRRILRGRGRGGGGERIPRPRGRSSAAPCAPGSWPSCCPSGSAGPWGRAAPSPSGEAGPPRGAVGGVRSRPSARGAVRGQRRRRRGCTHRGLSLRRSRSGRGGGRLREPVARGGSGEAGRGPCAPPPWPGPRA